MSRKFYAVHRQTGERWKKSGTAHQYLVMYDSGRLAVVTQDFYTSIEPLNNHIWRTVIAEPK